MVEAAENVCAQTGLSECNVPPCPVPSLTHLAHHQLTSELRKGGGLQNSTGRGQRSKVPSASYPHKLTKRHTKTQTDHGQVNTHLHRGTHTHGHKPSYLTNSACLKHTHTTIAPIKEEAGLPDSVGALGPKRLKRGSPLPQRALSSTCQVQSGPSTMNPHDTINLPPPRAHPQSQGRNPLVASLARPSTEQDKELVSKAEWSPPGLRATEDWAPGPKR